MSDLIPQGLSGVQSASDITQVDRLKLILLGEPGAGKSWCSCTGRKPVYVADFDDRSASIAGKKDIFIKSYVDRDPSLPHAWSDFESDLGTMEYAKQKGELKIKTIALASLTYMLKAAQYQLVKDIPSLSRSARISSHSYIIPQGWDAVNYAQRMMEGILNRLFELGIDIIAEAHIRREKDATSTEKNPVFTDKWTIEPQNMKMLLPAFNERWLVTNDNGFRVKTKPAYDFNAVTALHIDAEEDADIAKILVKHAANVAAGK